ncbi:sensor histidine kinase [Anaerobacillus isosaccharinicus]|uniref:PocR ligand-binding domain-containing protein n=1 Tax=Anaerobacillus isosaccharinicus TaxID=1532552 RepID=A0A1S2L4S3_9BACI|nr:PocR ligand-binding domain-containing protein [Anaerobacillus isosaccharinicus]MBA5584983.1 PocR ligand-binding domain-containing protein [Anaerobacillus isosaccharinicus]QOY36663.1 PocR ligand-binding domain-containing protein [Anaerobacillus isosaccharinicus]
MRKILQLNNVVEVEVLQKIQDDFSEVTGFAAITVDYRGKPFTKHSGCSKYCSIIRYRNESKDLCEKCDSRAGLEASRTGEPYIYMCHSGFIDFAAPIIVNGQYLGSIMGGQVVCADSHPEVTTIIDETIDIEEDVELIEAYTQIPIVPFKKIEAAAHLMFNIANKIAQKGFVNVIQKELHEQSLQLIQSRNSEANLETALKAAELKTLQSQINRQFLIQTLNIVGNLSFIEKAPQTEEATFVFIDVVKFLISNIGKEVTIEKELNYINNYLALQKIRLGEKFSYEILVAENTKELMIPSMMIQPIVENAIVHGIETKPGDGFVKVHIQIKDDFFEITVEDNGIGMSEHVIEGILQSPNDEHNLKLNLKVLKQRLIERYSNKARLYIRSKEGSGTAVTIALPLFKWT